MSDTRSAITLYAQKTIIRFRYTNYKMETESRRARIMSVWYGSSKYHQGPQWFLMAWDLDRDAIRNFAMRDMTEVSPENSLGLEREDNAKQE